MTVKIIKDNYNVDVTRQAVRMRALCHPKALQEIREDSVIMAEDTHRDLMTTSADDAVRRGCAEFILARIGKNSGYTPKIEIDNNHKIASEVHAYIPDNGRNPELKKPTDGEGSD